MSPLRLARLALVCCLLPGAPALASGGGGPAQAPAKKLTASRAFLTLDPFMVSIVENRKVRGFLVLEITLHIPDKDEQDGAQVMSPKLRDSYVRALMEYGAKVATTKRPPDLAGIAARLQGQTDLVIGAHKVRVLLTQALVRPL